jgi:hypothetical protein
MLAESEFWRTPLSPDTMFFNEIQHVGVSCQPLDRGHLLFFARAMYSSEALRGAPKLSGKFIALVLAVATVWAAPSPLWAQGSKQANKGPIYPKGFETTLEWQYTCPDGKGCSFNCPGSGGANNVTKLSIYLGYVKIGKIENAAGVFYDFTSTQTPRGSGFAITSGIGTLACQVQGMTLE